MSHCVDAVVQTMEPSRRSLPRDESLRIAEEPFELPNRNHSMLALSQVGHT